MRIALPALTAAALLLEARPMPGQSCFPVAVQLAVLDAQGRRMDPTMLDAVSTTPAGEWAPAAKVTRAPFEPATRHDTTNVLEWSRSGCRLELGTAALRMGDRTMRLRFDMVVDSEERRGASVFLFEAPPFQEGTFQLRWDAHEEGGLHHPQLLKGRWTRTQPLRPIRTARAGRAAPR